jgi:intracellular sulfur oxidation DsrE/DsrF family protein
MWLIIKHSADLAEIFFPILERVAVLMRVQLQVAKEKGLNVKVCHNSWIRKRNNRKTLMLTRKCFSREVLPILPRSGLI